MRIEPDTGTEHQCGVIRIDHPDARKRRPDAAQERAGALLHHGIELLRLHQGSPDLGVHLFQAGSKQRGFLDLLSFGHVTHIGLEERLAAHFEAGQEHLGGKQFAIGAAVCPFEALAAFRERGRDSLRGDWGRVATAGLRRR